MWVAVCLDLLGCGDREEREEPEQLQTGDNTALGLMMHVDEARESERRGRSTTMGEKEAELVTCRTMMAGQWME